MSEVTSAASTRRTPSSGTISCVITAAPRSSTGTELENYASAADIAAVARDCRHSAASLPDQRAGWLVGPCSARFAFRPQPVIQVVAMLPAALAIDLIRTLRDPIVLRRR